MIVQRGIKRRLVLAPEHVCALDAQAHAARACWNLLHDWYTGTSRRHRPNLYADAEKAIAQGRKDIAWLGLLPSNAAQQVLRTYRRAWEGFFAGRTSRPKFQARARARLAVDAAQASCLAVTRLNRRRAQVTLPMIGAVRFRWSGPIPGVGREPGRITGARLVKDALGWMIVFRTEVTAPEPAPHPGPAVGVDRGVTVALALSDGTLLTHRDWLRPNEQERLLRLERKAARQKHSRQPGQRTSHRLNRTYDQIKAVRAKATRRRLDWQHQTTTALARTYAVIGVEDLRLKNMTRSAKGTAEQPGTHVRQKAGLNRALLGEAHARTIELLTYKAARAGGRVVPVPAAYTSQTCSRCRYVDAASRNGTRFACTCCGFRVHADTNAAVNIERSALSITRAAGHGRTRTRSLEAVGAVKRQPHRDLAA